MSPLYQETKEEPQLNRGSIVASLGAAAFFVIPTVIAPQCVVVHDGICFESQAQYDRYMGWGPEQQTLEINANK